jgi:hypothetical protein
VTARRLGTLAAVALVAAAVCVPSARAALFFLFKPTAADAGDLVTVRLGGTPPRFTLADRERPFQQAMRIYLVPRDAAGEVRTRFDPRLHFVGRIVPDRRSRGALRFRVPPLDTGSYAVAAWCPACARHSSGRSFFVQTVPRVSRFRAQMGLQVELPPATETCPVTPGGVHGNGLLATRTAQGGVIRAQVRPEGLFQKLGWDALTTFSGAVIVRGERLDGPGRMDFLRANRGAAVWSGLYGWMTPVVFSSEGCWRVAARVDDVTLSYVARVVASS